MRKFIGIIILESLTDRGLLDGVQPLTEQTLLPAAAGAPVQHVRWYWLGEDELEKRLPALAKAMRPGWHAHFWAGDDLCVVLPGQSLWSRLSDPAAWQGLIDAKETVLPDFVREALAAESDDNHDLPWGNPYCCEV